MARRLIIAISVIAVVAAVAVAVALRGDAPPQFDLAWAVGDPCPDGVIIGAAGSGQRDDVLGVGPQVDAAVTGFRERIEVAASSVRVGFVALDYPAPGLLDGGLLGFLDNSMINSISEGTATLTSLVGTINEGCPASVIYLVGYSQGASVVHASVVDLPSQYRESIAAVVVLANPSRDADDPNTEHLTTEVDPDLLTPSPHTSDGVFSGLATPDWLQGSFFSACARRDAVCNFLLRDLLATDAAHTDETYHGLAAQLGELLAEDLLRRL